MNDWNMYLLAVGPPGGDGIPGTLLEDFHERIPPPGRSTGGGPNRYTTRFYVTAFTVIEAVEVAVEVFRAAARRPADSHHSPSPFISPFIHEYRGLLDILWLRHYNNLKVRGGSLVISQQGGRMKYQVVEVYLALDAAIKRCKLIKRTDRRDKEYHFQDWFKLCLAETDMNYEPGGRNSYPDFRLVHTSEGFEIKGLSYPGRKINYDANSQIPTGLHNGRIIYYVFGRYPKLPDGDEYPVVDLVLCHGDLLNADHGYVHENKHIKAFGSYGDIMIRDRKMYVAPTPFALLKGTQGRKTLILPSSMKVEHDQIQPVSTFSRSEVEKILVAYEFDLVTNEIKARFSDNPTAGRRHDFIAYRAIDDIQDPVVLQE